MTDDLEVLIPQPLAVKAGGKTLSLTPLKVSELSAFSRAVVPIIATLNGNDIDLFRLIAEHSDSVIEAVAVAVRESQEWIGELTVGELVLLAAKVIEVNADFFTRGVMPNLTRAFANLPAMPKAVGGSESSNA